MPEAVYLVKCGHCSFLSAPDLGMCPKCGYDGIDPESEGGEWVPAAELQRERERWEALFSLIAEDPPNGESSGVHIRRTRTGTWRIEVCEMEIGHDETWWPSFEAALTALPTEEGS